LAKKGKTFSFFGDCFGRKMTTSKSPRERGKEGKSFLSVPARRRGSHSFKQKHLSVGLVFRGRIENQCQRRGGRLRIFRAVLSLGKRGDAAFFYQGKKKTRKEKKIPEGGKKRACSREMKKTGAAVHRKKKRVSDVLHLELSAQRRFSVYVTILICKRRSGCRANEFSQVEKEQIFLSGGDRRRPKARKQNLRRTLKCRIEGKRAGPSCLDRGGGGGGGGRIG